MKQSLELLRPRSRPAEKHLVWIAEVRPEGRVECEAERLFMEYTSRALVNRRPVLKRSEFHAVGDRIDQLIGVCGSTFALLRRAVKGRSGGRHASLPEGWHRYKSVTTGQVFYQKGSMTQWQPPDEQVYLDFDAFHAVFWELLDSVDRCWGQAFRTKRSCIRNKADFEREYFTRSRPKRLGAGTFGAVELIQRKLGGLFLAVKKVEMTRRKVDVTEALNGEVERLRMLDHPNIVRLHDVFVVDKFYFLVMDYCSGGDLHKYVEKRKGRFLPERDVARIMRQLLKAVAHVHARGLLHLDIKPANAVIVEEMNTLPPGRGQEDHPTEPPGEGAPLHVMLIDLGLSRIFLPGDIFAGTMSGTPSTMAPEVWRLIETPAADIFSLGCVFFFMLTGGCHVCPFFPPPVTAEEAKKFWAAQPKHSEYVAKDFYSPEAYSLCDSMLLQERTRRPTSRQCLQDDFFRERDKRDYVGPKALERLKRLPKVVERSTLYRSVALAVASKWPAYRMPSIRTAFQELDLAGTGRLRKAEIERTLVSVGVDAAVAHAAADAMDLSRDGMVDWTEFVAACVQLGCDSLEDDLFDVFAEADLDQDGFLDKEDIARLLAIEYRRNEAVDEAMKDLLDQTEPTRKVDWETFRRHFSSFSFDGSP